MPPDLRLDADWRRPAYAIPIAIASALVLLAAGRMLLGLAGLLLHPTGVFAGTGPLATIILFYLVLLEIPGRKLLLESDAISIKSCFQTTTIAWADIADVQPGAAGWMNVNRQLPVAARLALCNTAKTVPVPNVFPMRREDVYDRVRSHWLAARRRVAEAPSHPTTLPVERPT